MLGLFLTVASFATATWFTFSPFLRVLESLPYWVVLTILTPFTAPLVAVAILIALLGADGINDRLPWGRGKFLDYVLALVHAVCRGLVLYVSFLLMVSADLVERARLLPLAGVCTFVLLILVGAWTNRRLPSPPPRATEVVAYL
jgi:hypothetical protein